MEDLSLHKKCVQGSVFILLFLYFISDAIKRWERQPMEEKGFENLFGASVARYKDKVVSCAYREQFDGSYKAYKSNMGKHHFSHKKS